MTLPILYSLRNCPFAMRARIAIYKSQRPVVLREVNLKNKPSEMIQASNKATVPIIVLPNTRIIDESLEVILWALEENDPDNLLHINARDNIESSKSVQYLEALNLVQLFDNEFKPCLEAYKCAKRYHEPNLTECRQACEHYIEQLEHRLQVQHYFISDSESFADIAILPFIRQFARVERQWYLQSNYPKLKHWLSTYLQSPMFTKVMAKHPVWSSKSETTIFAAKS